MRNRLHDTPTRGVLAGPTQARLHTGCGLAPPPHDLRPLSWARFASPLSLLL